MGLIRMAKDKAKGIAKTLPMRALDEAGVPYEVHLHAHKQYTSAGVAEDLGVPTAQVVKAMIVQRSVHGPGQGEFAVMVVPGDRKLSLKKVAAALSDKGVRLAAERDVIRVTGYQIGSVSVLGFRRDDIAGYVDRRVLELLQAIISAGRPDAGLALAPDGMVRAMAAQVADLCEEG
jgi:Cys-tRNA(Pro)/Cys-tRNA(Cys) deacylase